MFGHLRIVYMCFVFRFNVSCNSSWLCHSRFNSTINSIWTWSLFLMCHSFRYIRFHFDSNNCMARISVCKWSDFIQANVMCMSAKCCHHHHHHSHRHCRCHSHSNCKTTNIYLCGFFHFVCFIFLALVGFYIICIIDACLSERIENIYLVTQVWNCESVRLASRKYAQTLIQSAYFPSFLSNYLSLYMLLSCHCIKFYSLSIQTSLSTSQLYALFV